MLNIHDLIDSGRLWGRVNRLAEFTRDDIPWTRRAFTPLFCEARQWLTQQMQEAGLKVHLDAAGNLVGRREGKQQISPLVTGSHCDTVVSGGRFDGIIGVLAGIEIAHRFRELNIELRHPLEVIDFLSEEPSDYGISCVGSRAFSGELDSNMLKAKNQQGETLADAMRRIGANPDQLERPLRQSGETAAFVELHIEQGPVLESENIPVGIVTHIVGIRRVLITVTGQPDHAGTTPMNIRRDALVGASYIIGQVRDMAESLSGNPSYVVATIGRLTMTPNVPNAVPGWVELMLEVRSDSQQVLDIFPEQIMKLCREPLRALRLEIKLEHVSRARPTVCSEKVMQAIASAAEGLNLDYRHLPSGAGHDTVYVEPTGPVGMIFIPCLNGRSHCPEELISELQLARGATVLAQSLINLDECV